MSAALPLTAVATLTAVTPMQSRPLRLPAISRDVLSARNAMCRRRRPFQATWLGELWTFGIQPHDAPARSDWYLSCDWGDGRAVIGMPESTCGQLAAHVLGTDLLPDWPQDLLLACLECAAEQLTSMIEEATRKLIRLVAIGRHRPVGLERVGVHARCDDREIVAELFMDESACRYLAAAMREQPLEPDQAHWEDIGIRAGLLIGWVDLPGRSLANLGLRDVVLLDECLLSRGNNLLLQLAPAIGLRCELSGGQLRVVEGVHEIMSDAQEHTESAPALLDDVPVRLTFDLGEREIPLGELRTLLPGYLFNLGRDPRHTVNIRANGRVIGEGELVEIEGRVGVSVLRLGATPVASA